ncbi:MAG: GNAT family N-acetyltransferase [Deltaproteobacteria bacterium]|nr:MAG: GNAT family N-acetyltransferase [Deltaproteobacteria bacterium]
MAQPNHGTSPQVRLATPSDQDAVWEIFHPVVAKGDTYVFDPQTPKKELEQHWFAPYMKTYVLEHNRQITGTYILKPNFIGAGSHIANASYMVHPEKQGQGMGRILCEHSIQEAQRLGFLAMQFNIVVSTNQAAIALWKKYGFAIIGTTPNGFQHPQQGLVDTHIMYKEL